MVFSTVIGNIAFFQMLLWNLTLNTSSNAIATFTPGFCILHMLLDNGCVQMKNGLGREGPSAGCFLFMYVPHCEKIWVLQQSYLCCLSWSFTHSQTEEWVGIILQSYHAVIDLYLLCQLKLLLNLVIEFFLQEMHTVYQTYTNVAIHSHNGKRVTGLCKKSTGLPRSFFLLSATQELHMIFLSDPVFSFASGFAHFSNLPVVFILLMLFKSQGAGLGSLQGWQTGISDGMVKFFKPQRPNSVFSETKLPLCLTGTGDHTVACNFE